MQGVLYKFCKLIGFIYKNTQNYIRTGTFLANPFKSTTGCPQGCGLSSICFSLFVADLPNCLLKLGPKLEKTVINYIQYADDLAIVSRSPKELQKQLKRIEDYCEKNNLSINAQKRK